MVSTHSKQRKLIIYSAYLCSRDEAENLYAHNLEVRMLKLGNHSFKVVKGVYKGVAELSIVKNYSPNDEEYILSHLEQESCLILTNHKHGVYKATLHFVDHVEEIGFFRQVSKEFAMKQDCYTVDGKNYFAVTESDSVVVEDMIKAGLK